MYIVFKYLRIKKLGYLYILLQAGEYTETADSWKQILVLKITTKGLPEINDVCVR